MIKVNNTNGNTKTMEMPRADMGLSGDAVENVISTLTQALADIQVLYVKTLNVHWNIVGPSFYGIHSLLDEQYNALKADGDAVAERIRGYGVPVIGSMNEFLEQTRLKEKSGGQTVDIEALGELVTDHETVIRNLRKDIDSCAEEYGDQAAADLLTGQLQKHQDMAWMLRSFLPKS